MKVMVLRDQCDWSELLELMTILIEQVVRRSAVKFRATKRRLFGNIHWGPCTNDVSEISGIFDHPPPPVSIFSIETTQPPPPIVSNWLTPLPP